MAKQQQDETLHHNAKMGEVDPRSYFLLCSVKLACAKIGDHERILQLNRLNRAVDLLADAEGEPRTRIHFTACPGTPPAAKVEVRVQFCSVNEEAERVVSEKMLKRVQELAEMGKTAGWSLV